MILDANDLPDGTSLQADICIIGAGAAGIAMALRFIGDRRQVLVLESGGLKPERATQDLYAGTVVDDNRTQVLVIRVEHRADSPHDDLLLVVCRDEDGDRRGKAAFYLRHLAMTQTIDDGK